MKMLHCVCFDLSLNTDLNHYLPTAYIALVKNDKIEYIEKKASLETLSSYEISLNNNLKTLLEICNVLKIESLEKKYNPKNNSKTSLKELLKTKSFGKLFDQFISFKLSIFIEIISKNEIPLCINLNRQNPFFVQQISFYKEKLNSKLHFLQLENKIIYTLFLEFNNLFFLPSKKETHVILNNPAWVVIDKKLCQLNEINGNKLLPFIKKESIEILEKNYLLYFETFIKDILNKVEIETEGFEIEKKNVITKCVIEPIFNFISDKYYLNIIFKYENTTFSINDKRKYKSNLSVKDSIEVIQTKRNFLEEEEWLKKLSLIGINQLENDFLEFDTANHKYHNIQLLIENKSKLEEKGFGVECLEIENKKITSNVGFISIQNEENEDWFDLKMMITCGEYVFSFTEIIPSLKSNNPFYQLPNGSYFLIPNEWFSEYKTIIEFGKISGKSILIKKNQFTLLNNLTNVGFDNNFTKESVNYVPSQNLKASLRNYQIEGVNWLIDHRNNKLGACLADDMGLGKTLQTLAVLQFVKDNLKINKNEQVSDLFSEIVPNQEALKALIIVPTSLIFNWKNETKKFTPHLKSIIYTGTDRHKIKSKLKLYDIVFTSYAVVLKDIEILKSISFRYIILDESQYIKNKNSKIFNAITQINAESKITLSGTPIENSLDDLWSQMQFINPDLLGNYSFFQKHFKIPIEKKKDENAISELKKLIHPFILRRTKEQVAKDLPALVEQLFFSEMETEQKEFYEKEKSTARNYLLKTENDRPLNKLNVLNTLMKLRQISNHPQLINDSFIDVSGKFNDVTKYLETLLLAKQKVLLFSSFVKHLEIYTRWCKENNISFCLLTGETENRENQVEQFQNNPDKLLFFISLKSGGVGLNLTEASYVLLLDPWWNPFAENQAIARAHRIGQNNRVNVVRFIAKDTIEEKIMTLQERKKSISEAIIDINTIPDDIEKNLDFILD